MPKMYPHSKGMYVSKPSHYESEKFSHHEVDKRPKTEACAEIPGPKFNESIHNNEGGGIIPAKSSY